ncbi:MAG: L-threonylcarbamoyladenylate synthase [Clostridia bacterium]
MDTTIEKINESSIAKASEIIKNGGIVAFPTETVYGLGVSAYRGESVSKVFEVKGRPSDNPLIVHIGGIEDIGQATENPTPLALKILNKFSPGPITVVVDKGVKIANEVTAGLDSVGIRIPMLLEARQFIKACGEPIAAPSANTSSRPSPTNAMTVFDDIGGKIPMILDGGSCEVGIESTVVDCRGEIPMILRSGKITQEDIKNLVGACEIATDFSKVRSPGVKYKHYSPSCEMLAIFQKDNSFVQAKVDELVKQNKNVVLIGEEKLSSIDNVIFITLGNTVDDFMKNYYEALREGETCGDVIVCVLPFSEHNAEGIYNRVRKSCGGNISL